MVLGVENDANKDLTKNVKIVFSLQRESKNEGSEASQKPSKIDEETSSQTCWQKVSKNCPKWVNLESNLGPKRWVYFGGFASWGPVCFVFVFLLFLNPSWGPLGAVLGPTWGHFGTILGPFWNNFVPCLDHQCFNFFVLFVFTSLTSLPAFFQGLADCAQRFNNMCFKVVFKFCQRFVQSNQR